MPGLVAGHFFTLQHHLAVPIAVLLRRHVVLLLKHRIEILQRRIAAHLRNLIDRQTSGHQQAARLFQFFAVDHRVDGLPDLLFEAFSD